MDKKPTGIPETMLITLWARAVETARPEPIVKDEKAVEVVQRIDYDFSKFQKARLSQVGVSIRTMLFDKLVRHFLTGRPNAVVINLGAGLDTRFSRLDCASLDCWYELDLPEAVEVRRQFLPESDNNRYVAKSIFDYSWMDELETDGKSVLLIAEGLLMYFDEDLVKNLFRRIASRFPGAVFLAEMLAPFMVGKSRMHDSVSKMGEGIEFKWGPKNSRAPESWAKGIRYENEWDFLDYHRDRWGLFGIFARLPLVRPRFSNRIVQFRFE